MLLVNAIVLFSAVLPMLVALGFVILAKRLRDREGRSLPISAKVLHAPGEQIRQRVEALDDKLTQAFAVFYFIGPFLVAGWALAKLDLSHVTLGFLGWFNLALLVAIVGYYTREMIHVLRERRNCLDGLIAEQYTAQELNRLMGSGATVFHDVPGDGFNIDHVVIGPSAVYAVETKSRRKPRKSAAGDHYRVGYDGKVLRFPDHVTSKPIEQALRQAAWLSKEIETVTAKRVPVIAVVSLPGWFVDSPKSFNATEVRVISPSGRGASFMSQPGPSALDDGTRALVARCVVMLYPETPASMAPATPSRK
jgi:hypothetical protein